jgi:transcriptional regulator with XRE-family HTH domain
MQSSSHETSRRSEAAFRTLLLAVTLDPHTIGRRIADARRRMGWTQLDFAYQAGVSPSAVQRWERGGMPRIKKLIQIAELLNVPVDELVEPPADHEAMSEAQQQARLERMETQLSELRGMVAQLLQQEPPQVNGAARDPVP